MNSKSDQQQSSGTHSVWGLGSRDKSGPILSSSEHPSIKLSLPMGFLSAAPALPCSPPHMDILKLTPLLGIASGDVLSAKQTCSGEV